MLTTRFLTVRALLIPIAFLISVNVLAADTFLESGKASVYSSELEGQRTTSGEVFRQNLQTAAHRTLPFGTKVKVTNLRNGKSVVVKINDRGPHVKGRIIDLSKSAFSSISRNRTGVIEVRIEVVE